MTDILTPQQLSEEGTQAFQKGQYDLAANSFAAAAEGYTAAGKPVDSAEMKNNQSVALLKAGDAQGALDAVTGTESIFQAAGDIRRQGFAVGNEASALEALGRLEEAAEKYQQSADLLETVGEDQMRAAVLSSLSALQLKQGKHIDAAISMQSGVIGVKKPTLKQRIAKTLIKFRIW
jgi:tetratricopeptide (TPR) repeat protein